MSKKYHANIDLKSDYLKIKASHVYLTLLLWSLAISCLFLMHIPKAVKYDRVLYAPISFSMIHKKNLKFSIDKNVNYCLKIERDREFPVQNLYTDQRTCNLKELTRIPLEWKISRQNENKEVVSHGVSKIITSSFLGRFDVGITLNCLNLAPGQYILDVSIIGSEPSLDHWTHHLVIQEGSTNGEWAVAIAYISGAAMLIFIFLASLLTLYVLYRLIKKCSH